jgi:hypothetical protein
MTVVLVDGGELSINLLLNQLWGYDDLHAASAVRPLIEGVLLIVLLEPYVLIEASEGRRETEVVPHSSHRFGVPP